MMKFRQVKALLLALSIVLLFSVYAVKLSRSDGESWLDGWIYRKSHIIANATGAGADYQVNITSYYGSGSDTGNMVYLNSHCETDFADVRFTDNDGGTLLDYWMETYYASDNATFWVEVADSLESSDVFIYIYYGNNTVSTTSNIFNTFSFADDFEDNSYTSGLNWTTRAGTPDESGGILTLQAASVKSTSSVITGHKFRTLAKLHSIVYSGQIGCNDASGTLERAYFWTYGATGNRTHTRDASISEDQSDVVYSTAWVTYHYCWEVTDQFVKFYMDDVLENTHTTRVPDDAMEIRLGSAINNPKIEFEWIFIAKYVSPEPVHGAWGTEESEVVVSYLTFYHTGGGIIRVNNATMTNGTEEYHVNNTLIEFEIVAIPMNSTYLFGNFTWDGSYNYSNPYNFSLTILGNTTLWTYFTVGEEKGNAFPLIALILFVGGLATTMFVVVWKKH